MADYNINAITRRVVYTGSAGLGPYSFTFEVLDENDIAVYFNATKLTITTDYTVTVNANGTGSVTIVTGGSVPATPDADDSITIVGARDIERTTDFVTAGDLRASALNEQLDGQIIMTQQLAEENKRSMQAPVTDPAHVDDGGTLDMTLPAKDSRKGKYLQFNSSTGNPEAGPDSADVTTLADIATDVATLADIEDGTDATDAIQTVAGISSNVSTVAGISSNVTTVAGISSDVTAVAGDATDIGTVAGISSDVTSVAGISGNVTTVAGISADVTAVADDATDIGAVAAVATEIGRLGTADAVADLNTLGTADVVSDMNTLGTAANVTNMDTLAGISANITTVAGISSDVTTVAGDAADIATVAADSADIQAVAADGTDIGLVAGQISPTNNISTVAGISSNVSTVAGISSNVTTVAGNTTNINTVAGISSNVTTVAGDSADIGTIATDLTGSDTIGTVAGSISNVNTVATNIANVNTTATNITGVNSFAERYRVGSSDPTTSLDEGDLAYNSTANALKYYNGTSWVSIAPGIANVSDDSSPQLGGDLDLNNSDITGTGDINITGTITGSGDLTIDTNTLYVDATNNRVGIGTTAASAFSSDANNLVVGSGSGNEGITINSGSSGNGAIFFAVGTAGNNAYRGQVDYDHANDRLMFATAATERMRIDSSGKVGVGTSSPTAELSVGDQSGSDTTPEIHISGTGSGTKRPALRFYTGTNELGRVRGDSGTGLALSANSRPITFSVDSDSSEAMRLDSSGNLGIGTSSPAYPLDVVGTIRLRQVGSETFATIRGPSNRSLRIDLDANGDTDSFIVRDLRDDSERFIVQAGGNVGIGTSSPSAPLTVISNLTNGQVVASQNQTDNADKYGTFTTLHYDTAEQNAHIIAGSSGTTDNKVYIGGGLGEFNAATQVLFYTAANNTTTAGSERMRLDSSGNLLVGKTSVDYTTVGFEATPSSAFQANAMTADGKKALLLARKTSDGDILEFRKNSTDVGSISVTGSGTTYNTTSDIRLKTDIAPIADATDKLMAMNAVTHKWKADPDADAVVGFIAQEMAEIVPEAVHKGEGDDMWSMDYGRITPVLVAALQDAHNKIEQLEQRIAEMEAK